MIDLFMRTNSIIGMEKKVSKTNSVAGILKVAVSVLMHTEEQQDRITKSQ